MKRTITTLAIIITSFTCFSQAKTAEVPKEGNIKLPAYLPKPAAQNDSLPNVIVTNDSPLSVTLTVAEWQTINTAISNSEYVTSKRSIQIGTKIDAAFKKAYPQPKK